MDDDFNTPVALAAFQQLRGEINTLIRKGISTEVRKEAREEFRSLGRVFGLFQLDRWQFNLNVGREAGFSSDLEVQKMVDERTAAKKAKDFKRADAIRQALTAQGIIIEDKPDGTSRWKR
jgi:cysteinyl-tRNA synthetase